MIPMLSLGPNSWFGPWMNRQQLLSRFPDNFNILYSQGLFQSWELGNKQWRSANTFSDFQKSDRVTIHVKGKFPVKFKSGSFLDRVMVSMMLDKWKRELDWRDGEGVGYFFSPEFTDYARYLKPKCIVYHVYDQFQSLPGWTKSNDINHRWMLDHADIVIASSEMIAKSLEKLSGREVSLVENGVDFSAFSANYDVPDEFEDISDPKIVYTGNINRKIDLPLIYRLSIERPDWKWFFIGRVNNLDEVTERFYKKLLHRDNVFFLGYKSVSELPSYVTNSSVNIMNYRLGKGLWSDSGYPLKLNEYLAAGRPIVSCNIQAVQRYSEVISVAKTDEDWLSLLNSGINERNQSMVCRRVNIARENSWESKVDSICELILDKY